MTVPDGFGEVVEQLRRSTVAVSSGGHGGGSGFVIDAGGMIITNAHVVGSPTVQVQFWNGQKRQGRVLARDGGVDLALVLVPPGGLLPARLADSGPLRQGDFVIAVGNPFGFIGAVTTGTLKGVGKVRGLGEADYLQAAIRLAPGNSGGPMADAGGRIIGVNAMVIGSTALAIPSAAVREFLRRVQTGTALGVVGRKVPLMLNGVPRMGLVLLEIQPGSSADRAALLPGDILIGVNDQFFSTANDIDTAFDVEGDRVAKVQFVRGDRTHLRSVAIIVHSRRNRAA